MFAKPKLQTDFEIFPLILTDLMFDDSLNHAMLLKNRLNLARNKCFPPNFMSSKWEYFPRFDIKMHTYIPKSLMCIFE